MVTRIPLPFAGTHAQGNSLDVRNMLCDNLYPEIERPGSKTPVSLHKVPGLTKKYVVGYGPIRSSGEVYNRENEVLFVSGDTLYEVSLFGQVTARGTLDTSAGPVSMAAGRTQVCIADGTPNQVYVYQDGTLAKVVTPFTTSIILWVGSYFIALNKDTDQWYMSANDDATAWNALDFATAEARPDSALAAIELGGYLAVFGQETTEVYANTGNSMFPFEKVTGGTLDYGILAPWSVAKNGNHVFWIGASRRGGGVVLRAGMNGAAMVVSDRDIEAEFAALVSMLDAQAFLYQQAGHEFYQITFPSAGKTYCLDTTTGYWHTRSAPDGTRHRASGHVYFNGMNLVGDYETGDIYMIDPENHENRWKRRFQVISKDGRMIQYRRVELTYERGTAVTSGKGSDPVVMMRQSNDGGRRFGNESYRRLGKTGEYHARAVWSGAALNSGRDKVFEFSGADPVKTVILGGYMDVEIGV